MAVGIFHDIGKLRDAIEDLSAADGAESDIVLLCESGAIGDRLTKTVKPVSDGRIRLLVRDGENRPDATQSKSRTNNPQSGLSQDQILHFETWIEAQLADNLDGQLKRGGCLLLCPVLSAASEQSVSNILLRHSADPVQLHDTRPEG